MSNILNKNLFLIKEHIGILKAANNFDIFNPEDGQLIMTCREETLGVFTKLLRFTDYKKRTPFDIEIKTTDGKRVIRVKRGISFFLSNVSVVDEHDRIIGRFKQKLFSIGGAFNILDPNDKLICYLKGKWTGWDFKFISDGKELAHVTKKWAGLGKEFFTSADNYMLNISESVPKDDPVRKLILAAIMCIDMVLKE